MIENEQPTYAVLVFINLSQFIMGDICKACGLFVPDGCGWWLFPDEDGNYFEGYDDDEDE